MSSIFSTAGTHHRVVMAEAGLGALNRQFTLRQAHRQTVNMRRRRLRKRHAAFGGKVGHHDLCWAVDAPDSFSAPLFEVGTGLVSSPCRKLLNAAVTISGKLLSAVISVTTRCGRFESTKPVRIIE